VYRSSGDNGPLIRMRSAAENRLTECFGRPMFGDCQPLTYRTRGCRVRELIDRIDNPTPDRRAGGITVSPSIGEVTGCSSPNKGE
jgi:hypothetical protein